MESKVPGALCSACPFKDRPIAKTTGPAGAKIAVVSRSPGHYEALNGKSFAGPSGKVLDHLLKLQGVDRNEVLATNVVLCQSEGPQEAGWKAAATCCSGRLALETKEAATIIACGGEAAQAFTGQSNIFMNRGYVHHINDQRVIVTNNPAMVLRDDGTFPELVRDFKLAINPLPQPKLPDVRWITDVDEAKKAAQQILAQLSSTPDILVAVDIEARGKEDKSGLAHDSDIVCLGISIRADKALVFGERPCADESFVGMFLRPLLELDNAKYLWHNGKYDIKILRTHGISARVDEDTLLLSWALDERPGNPESGAGGHSLEWLLKDELGWPKYEPPSVRMFKKTGVLERAADLYKYNGFDTAGCYALFSILKQRAITDNVYERPYRFMLIRLSEALTKVELEGNLYDDVAAANILEDEVWPTLKAQKQQMRDIVGDPKLNPNSPKQLETLIYDTWKLTHQLQRPKVERKGKRSTDKAVREEITRGDFKVPLDVVHPDTVKRFIELLDDFKRLDKQRSNYLEGLILKRFPNGRIYTDFKIHGTESARLSSSNPNLQNITRPKEGLPNIRDTFIADPGCSFISADLSQAELRAIAVLSGCKALQSIYLDTGRSLHKEVAAKFYGDNYTYEQYVRAKNINFGVVYWQSAFTFSQMYHMPEKEAQDYIDFWWSTFPEVWDWTKSIEKTVLEVGELQSPFGHKRRFYVIPSDQSGRLHAIKSGINFLPQNIAGNITLWALIRLCETLDWDIAQVRFNVHDNIVVNCKNSHVPEIAKYLKHCMENAVKEALDWDFPFTADVSAGPTWGKLEELKIA